MGITTTASLAGETPRPLPRCHSCGWPIEGLAVRGYSDHDLVHDPFDGCPDGEPPVEDKYTAIAHDPFAEPTYLPGTRVEVFRADLRAIELLKEKKVGEYRAGLTTLRTADGEVFERVDLVKARKAIDASRTGPSFPGESAEEDAYLKGQALPLGAGRRKASTR